MAFTDASFDMKRLALGVLYVNLGRAAPAFPTTTRAHPSYYVTVDLIPPVGVLTVNHKHYFPFRVRWDIWQKIVVPVFSDGEVLVKTAVQASLRNQMQRAALLIGDYDSLLLKFEMALRRAAQDEGYIPECEDECRDCTETDEGPGEPVVPPGTNDGSPYTRFD